jgi:hypothetical protein
MIGVIGKRARHGRVFVWAMAAKAQEQRDVECLQRSQAARLARKCPRALFPSLAASAMLSKNTGERSTGADLPAQ